MINLLWIIILGVFGFVQYEQSLSAERMLLCFVNLSKLSWEDFNITVIIKCIWEIKTRF